MRFQGSQENMDFKEEPRAELCFTSSMIIWSYTFPFLILSLLKWPHKMGCAAVSTVSYLGSRSLQLYPLFILMNTDWPRVTSHQWLPSEISLHCWECDFSSGAPMYLLGREEIWMKLVSWERIVLRVRIALIQASGVSLGVRQFS